MCKLQQVNDEYWLSENVTINDILQLIKEKPELKHFLDKRIVWHDTDRGTYDVVCVVRLSTDHDEVLIDGEYID